MDSGSGAGMTEGREGRRDEVGGNGCGMVGLRESWGGMSEFCERESVSC